jgi:chromosome segregation ATPase
MKSIISEQNVTIKSLNESIKEKDSECVKLNENLAQFEKINRKLTEGVNAKDKDIKSLNESLEAEKTRLNESVENLKKQNAKLNESLQEAKKDSQIIKSEANAKITKCNQLTEKYKSIAKTAVDRYIECKATTLGISSAEIKNRLKENYSFNDIEKVCEDLQRYKLNMRALPFDINAKKQVRVKINESKKIIDPVVSDPGVDDEIDETLSSFV